MDLKIDSKCENWGTVAKSILSGDPFWINFEIHCVSLFGSFSELRFFLNMILVPLESRGQALSNKIKTKNYYVQNIFWERDNYFYRTYRTALRDLSCMSCVSCICPVYDTGVVLWGGNTKNVYTWYISSPLIHKNRAGSISSAVFEVSHNGKPPEPLE